MESRSEWEMGPNGERAEVGVFVHEGREYRSGGAFVSATHAVGYPKLEGPSFVSGVLQAWDGTVIGTARVVASWKVRGSQWDGFRPVAVFQIECVIDGRMYTGRGQGSGMLWRGRAKRVAS